MLSCKTAHIKISGGAFLISIHSELDFTFNFDLSCFHLIREYYTVHLCLTFHLYMTMYLVFMNLPYIIVP